MLFRDDGCSKERFEIFWENERDNEDRGEENEEKEVGEERGKGETKNKKIKKVNKR